MTSSSSQVRARPVALAVALVLVAVLVGLFAAPAATGAASKRATNHTDANEQARPNSGVEEAVHDEAPPDGVEGEGADG